MAQLNHCYLAINNSLHFRKTTMKDKGKLQLGCLLLQYRQNDPDQASFCVRPQRGQRQRGYYPSVQTQGR